MSTPTEDLIAELRESRDYLRREIGRATGPPYRSELICSVPGLDICRDLLSRIDRAADALEATITAKPQPNPSSAWLFRATPSRTVRDTWAVIGPDGSTILDGSTEDDARVRVDVLNRPAPRNPEDFVFSKARRVTEFND